MSDEKADQKSESDKAEKPADEPDKASAAADKPAAQSDKAEETAAKPADQPIAAGAAAAKSSAPKAPRTKKEKILIGALVAAVLGFIWAVVHMREVIEQAKNPYSQTAQPAGKPPSEADLEKDEAQFAPKNPVLIPAGSAVLIEKPKAATAKAKTTGAKAAKTK